MLDVWGSLAGGIISGFGMFIVSTIFALLTFKLTKKWITKTVSEIWKKVREEGLQLDNIQIEGRLETKKGKSIDGKNKKGRDNDS